MADKDDTNPRDAAEGSDEFKARRRLLKASAAAPLIATLSPSAALAQGSLTCANNGLNDGALQGLKDTLPVSPSDDNAVRVLGTCWEKANKADIWEVPKFSMTYYSSDGSPVPDDFPTNDWKPRDCYFLEFFSVQSDGSVQRVGTYPRTSMGDVLADSCWTSIAMGQQGMLNRAQHGRFLINE